MNFPKKTFFFQIYNLYQKRIHLRHQTESTSLVQRNKKKRNQDKKKVEVNILYLVTYNFQIIFNNHIDFSSNKN